MRGFVFAVPTPQSIDRIPSRVLALDDERQIHASLRLRLADSCELVSAYSPKDALSFIKKESFDLCIVDIHMSDMDGLAFIEAARQLDPALSYIILTGFVSEENLRRAIPLQVLDFLSKPLPDRSGFEQRIPDWINRTRMRRHELALAEASGPIEEDLVIARIERDVESTASESAREALLQTANLLTTIQALLVNATLSLDKLGKNENTLASIHRSLQEARRISEAAATIAEGYFSSAYADRESSPALIGPCLDNAVGISRRLTKADDQRKAVDLSGLPDSAVARGITGMDFLLMIVPALGVALALTKPDMTVEVRCDELLRLDAAYAEDKRKHFLWANRKYAVVSHPGVLITIRTTAPALEHAEIGAWLRGQTTVSIHIPSRGLMHGLEKSKGLLGVSVTPLCNHFEMVLALPT
jgi:CheY-like chemotaxis protein